MNMISRILHNILLRLASRLYDVVLVHAPEDEITAIHFARSTTDLNQSCREYVEWLDENASY